MVKLVNNRDDIGRPTARQNVYVILRKKIRQFKRDVEGGLIILTLLLLISMLVVGGMAVDFMRLESERVKLQSVSDRSVLAAANLNQGMEPADVVADFFKVEGFAGAITSNLDAASGVEKTASDRRATVKSASEIDTFYLRLAGMDTLVATASSSASAGTGRIEISLVLDMSLSMNEPMTGEVFQIDADGEYIRFTEDEVKSGGLSTSLTGRIKTTVETHTRMFFLRQAANKFVADLLQPEYKDLVSFNLIGYSDHVSLGDELYRAIRTTPDSIAENGATGSSYAVSDASALYAALNGSLTLSREKSADPLSPVPISAPDTPSITVDTSWAGSFPIHTNPSRCVMLEDADFQTLAFDVNRIYQQVPHVDLTNHKGVFDADRTTCPPRDFQGIIAMSQDVNELQTAISSYEPLYNTSSHIGMKWGTALLDPSMRPVIDRMASVDPAFRGSRPSNYRDGVTSKYIIILTDGLTLPADVLEAEHYDEYAERVAAEKVSIRRVVEDSGDPTAEFGDLLAPKETTAQLETKLLSLCNLAAVNVTDVYTISMGVNSTAMTSCASKAGNAFQSSITNSAGENNLSDVFDRISSQISTLRLTD